LTGIGPMPDELGPMFTFGPFMPIFCPPFVPIFGPPFMPIFGPPFMPMFGPFML